MGSDRLESIRQAVWMCCGNLIPSDLSLVPGTFTAPQTYCEVQRKVALGANINWIGKCSLLFSNYEINNSCVFSVPIGTNCTRAVRRNKHCNPCFLGTGILLKENEFSMTSEGKVSIRNLVASLQNLLSESLWYTGVIALFKDKWAPFKGHQRKTSAELFSPNRKRALSLKTIVLVP